MRKKQKPKKKLMLHLDYEQYQKVLEISVSEFRSQQSVIRQALAEFLERRMQSKGGKS